MYSTRFQGSKRRVLPWLLENLQEEMKEGLFVDVFAGSGLVAYGMAKEGNQVAGADRLLAAGVSLRAFIGNQSNLGADEALGAISPASRRDPLFRIYRNRFYPDEELLWLLGAARWGRGLRGDRRAAFFWALFQAALAKRPYNLFHRANLEMRTRSVERSFGNAKTWNRPFEDHLRIFLAEQKRKALPGAERPLFFEGDAARIRLPEADLLYLDPPYVPMRGEPIDYLDFYGFLDLLLRPSLRLDSSRNHRPLVHRRSVWEKRATFVNALQKFSEKYSDTTIALSYRKDGYPGPEDLQRALGGRVDLYEQPIKYALASKSTAELLFVRGPKNSTRRNTAS